MVIDVISERNIFAFYDFLVNGKNFQANSLFSKFCIIKFQRNQVHLIYILFFRLNIGCLELQVCINLVFWRDEAVFLSNFVFFVLVCKWTAIDWGI